MKPTTVQQFTIHHTTQHLRSI